MKIRISRLLGPLLSLLLFVAAVWLLCTKLTLADLRSIFERLRDIVEDSPGRIVAAVALTALNYVVLIGYDLLAIRYVGEKLSLRRVALASFTAYTCGYNFGSTIFGSSVRYRLYSAWGVPAAKILQLLVILALTFWFGLLALGGVVFVAAPLAMPQRLQEWRLPLTGVRPLSWMLDTRPFGWILLAVTVIYIGLSAAHRGSIKMRGMRLPVPPFRLTLYQLAIASADLLLVAAVLYTLWPASAPLGYLQVLGIYMLVFVTGVLTHVPGGYGVMEGVLISILPDASALSDVGASWLLFRVVYYIVPLMCSLALLGCYEFVLHHRTGRAHGLRPPEGRPAEPEGPAAESGHSAGSNGDSARSLHRPNPVDS
jgi:uncharacterized membrane protein YbhN (UPF0104 family)